LGGRLLVAMALAGLGQDAQVTVCYIICKVEKTVKEML
jgi:hypothetical protein